LKEQHIQALQDILIKSNLHENLMLLERALFNNNHCTFLSCETKIYAIRDEDTITVHTEILDLIPKNMMLITCQSKSSTHVSIWHNQLASLNKDTLILKDVMIPISHLKNESIANKDLRFLKSEEILLGTFHLFDSRKLQCLAKVDFLLNNQQTSCYELQTIQLPQDFILEFQGARISEQHTVSHINLVSNTWMHDYDFDNLPRSILQQDEISQAVIHPVIDTLVLDQAGNISIQKVSLLTTGTVILFFMVCVCALYKYESFRMGLWNFGKTIISKLYNCATTENHRNMKENKNLKKEVAIKKAQIRENINDLQLISQLEKSLEDNNQRKSLPNLTKSIQMEDISLRPQLELDHLGAHGGTAWHQLSVTKEPSTDTEELHMIGENSGRDWTQLRRLGQPVLHPKRRPE
jgi:hypothetical protein